MTTTAQNTKIPPNSQARKSPGNASSLQTLGQISQKICGDDVQKKKTIPHRETRQYVPILRNEQIQNAYKKLKNTKYIFSSDILKKVNVNQIKPT